METSTVTVAARGRARHLKSSVPINSGSLSFAERKAELARASMPKLVEGDDLVNDIDTPLPGDTMMKPGRPRSTAELARQRSAYFEDAFSTKCKVNPARERVRAAATIVAEVKTNVIVRLSVPHRLPRAEPLTPTDRRRVYDHHGALVTLGRAVPTASLVHRRGLAAWGLHVLWGHL